MSMWMVVENVIFDIKKIQINKNRIDYCKKRKICSRHIIVNERLICSVISLGQIAEIERENCDYVNT